MLELYYVSPFLDSKHVMLFTLYVVLVCSLYVVVSSLLLYNAASTQGHSRPPQRSLIKEKGREQANNYRAIIPAEHTTTIALLFWK